MKESTRQNHLSTLELLQEFKKEVLFTDLTFEFVSSFDNYLQSKGYHLNTIAKHMKHLKRYINVAINKEYMDIQKYAFRKYKIKSIEGSHTHLAPEELHKFENLQLIGRYTRLQKQKMHFICCYAGLRYSDFTNLTSANIVEFHQETWIIYKSVKQVWKYVFLYIYYLKVKESRYCNAIKMTSTVFQVKRQFQY